MSSSSSSSSSSQPQPNLIMILTDSAVRWSAVLHKYLDVLHILPDIRFFMKVPFSYISKLQERCQNPRTGVWQWHTLYYPAVINLNNGIKPRCNRIQFMFFCNTKTYYWTKTQGTVDIRVRSCVRRLDLTKIM